MDAVAVRGKRQLVAWIVLLLGLIAATRVAVVTLAVNGHDELPSQLLSDGVAAVVLLYVAFGAGRVEKWLGVLLFAAWGLTALTVVARLGAAVTMNLRGEVVFLLVGGPWGTAVQALAVVTGVAFLGFAGAVAWSPGINRYFAFRRVQSASRPPRVRNVVGK